MKKLLKFIIIAIILSFIITKFIFLPKNNIPNSVNNHISKTSNVDIKKASEKENKISLKNPVMDENRLKQNLLKGISSHDEQIVGIISSKKINLENIQQIIEDVIENNPQIASLYKGSHISYQQIILNTARITIKPQYALTKEQYAKEQEYIDKWVSQNIDSNMSQEKKVKKIHDFIVLKSKYNFGNHNNISKSKSGGYPVYTPSSLLFGKGGVCQAYAILFYKMAKKSGLEVKYVTGKAWNDNFTGDHAWNLIKICENWYHLDATWDDPINGGDDMVYHDYYLKSDDYMKNSRKWDYEKYPKALKSYRYVL